MNKDFKIGWSKWMISNGENIAKVTSLRSIQNQAAYILTNKLKEIERYDANMSISESFKLLKQTLSAEEFQSLKNRMPKIYVYNGKFLSKNDSDSFPGSDMFFIDLDTTEYVDEILANKDKIFNKIRYIRYIQRSISNKLHLICSFGDIIKTVPEWEHNTVAYTIFILDQLKKIGYDFFALQDDIIRNNEVPDVEKKKDIIDTHNMKWTQRLFCTPYHFLENPNSCPNRMEVDDEYFENLRNTYPYYFIEEKKKETKANSYKDNGEFVQNRYFNGVFEYEIVPNNNQFSDNEFEYEFRRKIYGALVKITDFDREAADALWKIVCSHYTLGHRHPESYYLAENLKNYFNYWESKAKDYCKNINAARWLAKYGIIVTNKNDDVIRIPADSYLSDYNDDIIAEWELHKKMQIVSPTGSGKTVEVIELAKMTNAIVIVPYLATNSLYSKDLELVTAGKRVTLAKDKAYVMVYDQAIKYIPTNRPIIIDESHTCYLERDFRDRLIVLMNLLKNQEKVLLVSATPCEELMLIGGDRMMIFTKYHHKVFTTFIHYCKEDEKNYNIQKKIEDLFIGNSKYERIVVMDDRIVKNLYEIYSPIFKDELLYFRASTRENRDCQELLKEELLKKKLTLCTRAGFNGLNFNNIDEKVLLIASLNVAQLIIQQAGRFRNIDINLHVYVNDESTETEEDLVEYYKAASDFSSENGAEFIIQNSKYDSEEFYKAKKQIVKFMNDNNCYDVCKKKLEETEYFIMCGDVNIMKMRGVKKDNTSLEISNMIKAGIDLDSINLNEIQLIQYKRFKDAIENFCKRYNIASPFEDDVLGIMSERTGEWIMRLINSFDNKLLIDSILDRIEEVVHISSMSDGEFSIQNNLAQQWISHISAIPVLNIKAKDNISKLKRINEIREERYGSTPLEIMDNLIIDMEEKKDLCNENKRKGGKKGGQKGKPIDIINIETNETYHFETQDECIEQLGISKAILSKIKNGKILRNKKEFNKYKIIETK